MIRITASDPSFTVINDLWQMNAWLKNPHIFYNLREFPQEFTMDLLDDVELEMANALDGLPMEIPEFLEE